MKSNKKIVESMNSFIKHQFIKRNTVGKTFRRTLNNVHCGNKIISQKFRNCGLRIKEKHI